MPLKRNIDYNMLSATSVNDCLFAAPDYACTEQRSNHLNSRSVWRDAGYPDIHVCTETNTQGELERSVSVKWRIKL
jgi:hypothetical protein